MSTIAIYPLTDIRHWHDKRTQRDVSWAKARYDVAFIGDGYMSCEACGIKRLETGNVGDGLVFVSLDQPNASGELCCDCLEWISEPFCIDCGASHELMSQFDDNNRCHDCRYTEGVCPECRMILSSAKEAADHLWQDHGYCRQAADEMASERIFPAPHLPDMIDAHIFADELANEDY